MSDTLHQPEGNQLIAGLPEKERQRLLLLCEPVDLIFDDILCEAQRPLQHAYFPLCGLISLVAVSSDHQPLGVATIGNEGVLGATLTLDINVQRLRCVVHGPGVGLSITAPRLHQLLRDCPTLQTVLRRYSYVLKGQIQQTAICNAFHEVEMRLARWLLTAHDRTDLEKLPLTHQFLADLLGVQRSAVSIAAGKLQRKKLIGYSRGQIRILSLKGLEAASCECYRMQIMDHAQQMRQVRQARLSK